MRHVRPHCGYVMVWHLISSAKQIADAQQVGSPDVWIDTGAEWIRVHNEPRTSAFVPTQGKDGPDVKDLALYRRTELWSQDGNSSDHKTVEDDWTEALYAKLGEKSWTGLTRFQKTKHTSFECNLRPSAGGAVTPQAEWSM